jgi:hypothetical protein
MHFLQSSLRDISLVVLKSIKKKKKTVDINKNLKLDSFFSRADNKAITTFIIIII